MKARALVTVVAALVTSLATAQTANFPSKPIRLIVPFPPPGPTDLVARAVGQKMSVTLGQPVVVENRAGATGAIGAEYVARAPADGHILLLGTGSTHAVAPAVNPKLPYDNLRDFAPITLLTQSSNILIVTPSFPATTVRELIALAKANPGKYNFASTGIGGLPHLAAELFMQLAGVRLTHVPFTGTGPALNAVMSGSVEIGFDSISSSPQVHAKRIRALALTGTRPIAELPGVAPLNEVLPGYEATTWVGLFAPANTPADVLDRLQAAARGALEPDVTQKMRDLGMTPVGSTREEFAEFVRKDTARWREVARKMPVPLN